MAAALEVIGMFGPNERSVSRIAVIKQLLCDRNFSSIHINCLCCLLQIGVQGLQSLLELAAKDMNGLSTYILVNLIQVRSIQRVILVPSILSQLNNQVGSSMSKLENLAMLNRLGRLVWEAGGLPILVKLIEEGNVDR